MRKLLKKKILSNADKLYKKNLFGENIMPSKMCILQERFTIPPSSVLDTRQGYWRDRVNKWKSIGIKSEIGRKQDVLGSGLNKIYYSSMNNKGISIFDPVLCELMYKWFCPVNGVIVDPFAGGSVRGIVASILGYKYYGCDLNTEQIIENRKQAELICNENKPLWVVGDALDVVSYFPNCDFIFSCPPYGNLEVYSTDKRDISNMSFEHFKVAYEDIICRCCSKLKDNRFVCFVVSDYRDSKTGIFNYFPDLTKQYFKNNGLYLYNDLILLNVMGTVQIRATRTFNGGRKCSSVHQNVLIFVKGDWKIAIKNLPLEKEIIGL